MLKNVFMDNAITCTLIQTSVCNDYHLFAFFFENKKQICAMAKRINMMNLPANPDLFILEFAVNDYQGQDHKLHVDFKMDQFFKGFRLVSFGKYKPPIGGDCSVWHQQKHNCAHNRK